VKKLIILMLFLTVLCGVQISVASDFEYNTTRNALSGLDPANVYISAGEFWTPQHNNPTDARVLYDGVYDMVEGYSGTRWCVQGVANGAYIIFDLERILEINRIVIHSGYSQELLPKDAIEALRDFDVYIWDGVDFVIWEEACVRGNTNHVIDIDNISASTKKLKIISRQEGDFRIREIIISSPQVRAELKVLRNNSEMNFGYSKPEVLDGNVMVPLEEVADALGISYRWNDAKGRSVITNDSKEITFTMGKKIMKVECEEMEIPAAPYLVGSRVYLPLRALAESLDYYVFWYDEEYTANIVSYEFLHNLSLTDMGPSPFALEAGGVKKEIFSTAKADFVQITCDGETEIELIYSEEIKSIRVLPQKENIKPTINNNKAHFTVQSGQHLNVEINDDLNRPLFVFVNPTAPRPDENDPNVIFLDKQKMYYYPIFRLSENQTVYLGDDVVLFGGFLLQNQKNIKIIGNGIIYSSDSVGACVKMMECESFEINGPVAINTGKWHNFWVKSENLKANNYKIIGNAMYSDGIDIVSSKDVELNKIFVRSDDDSICIKGNILTRPYTNGNVENVRVTNAVIWNGEGGNPIQIGAELDAEYVRDLVFKDIDVIHRETIPSKFQRAAITIHNAGTAHISDVLYEDIRVQSSEENLVYFVIYQSHHWTGSEKRGKITDITVKNMTLYEGPDAPSFIKNQVLVIWEGPRYWSDETVEVDNIVFENLNYKGMLVKSIADAQSCGFIIDSGINIAFK